MAASERLVRWSSLAYRFLLRAYPRDFRLEYGREMLQVFRSRIRDLARDRDSAAIIAFAIHILWDWFKTNLRERRDAMTRSSKLALAAGLIPAVAFTLHDLVFQLPDTEHEASLGFFLTAGALLLVWGFSGYFAARSRGAAGAACIKLGAIAGALSVGVLWLTYMLLNNLFLDRMSYEPDRIRAFQESGYASMRAYINQRWWLGPLDGPFAILLCAAALAGVAGAVIWSRRRLAAARP